MTTFIFLIPSAILVLFLILGKLSRKNKYIDLVASKGETETEIGKNGGLVRVDGKLIFAETYGQIIEKGSKVLIVKYIPEEDFYMVEKYV